MERTLRGNVPKPPQNGGTPDFYTEGFTCQDFKKFAFPAWFPYWQLFLELVLDGYRSWSEMNRVQNGSLISDIMGGGFTP